MQLGRTTLHIKPSTYLTSSDNTSSNFGFFPKTTFSVLSISISLLDLTIAGTEGFSSNRFLQYKHTRNLNFTSLIQIFSGKKTDTLRAIAIPLHLGNNPGNLTHKNSREFQTSSQISWPRDSHTSELATEPGLAVALEPGILGKQVRELQNRPGWKRAR